MPFVANTPEALVSRSDSKNPATTCRGLTSSGLPCRRALASNVARSNLESADIAPATTLFCWQHKDQADSLVAGSNSASSADPDQQPRTSIDTFVDRLGLNDVPVNKPRRAAADSRTRERAKHIAAQNGQRPRPDSKDDTLRGEKSIPASSQISSPAAAKPAVRKQKPSFWQSLCCASGSQDDDYLEIVKHKERTQDPTGSQTSRAAKPSLRPVVSSVNRPGNGAQTLVPSSRPPTGMSKAQRPGIPSSLSESYIQPSTGNLLDLLPQTLTLETRSLLFAELSKPVSPHDSDGYIYIFWLTPTTSFMPSSDLASSLLSNGHASSKNNRGQSETLKPFTTDPRDHKSAIGAPTNGKFLLKIGRASNVHRRLTQWSQQCGYTPSLLRWYPYIPTSATSSPTGMHSGNISKNPSRPPTVKATAPVSASSTSQSSSSPTTSITPLQSRGDSMTSLGTASLDVNKSPPQRLPLNRSKTAPFPVSAPPHLPFQGIKLPLQQGTPNNPSPALAPFRLPHAHRTERLIHIELASRRAKLSACATCGKEHREWFEVDASREGVRAVDEVVRRWVGWGLREGLVEQQQRHRQRLPQQQGKKNLPVKPASGLSTAVM